MPPQSRTDREDERRRFVADPDVLAALGVVVEQLSDPNMRALVIRHEHPEFEGAVKEGRLSDRHRRRTPPLMSKHASAS